MREILFRGKRKDGKGSIKIERVPRICLCELCKHVKSGKCTSANGDASFAVLSGRYPGFNSLLGVKTIEKINTLLKIEHYLSKKCNVIELTDAGIIARVQQEEKNEGK